jgi:competence protein ComEA
MMRGSYWHSKRLHAAGVLGRALMILGAAAVIGSLAVSEAKGIPGWEPANHAVREALAAEDAMRRAEAAEAASPSHTDNPASPAEAVDTVKGLPTAKAAEQDGLQNKSAPSEAAPSPLLDLNSATEAELDALPGIGPAKARAIIAYRETVRRFRTVDDLLEVKGIGPKLLEQIRPFVRAGSAGGT